MTQLPYLGVGLSYRWHLNPDIMRARASIDWLEITPEHFLPLNEDTRLRLSLLAKRFPLVGHGLELSLGSPQLNEGYLTQLEHLLGHAGMVWHGDHLCLTETPHLAIRALTPLPMVEEAVTVVAQNTQRVKARLGRPLVVENIAYAVSWPMNVLDEASFVAKTLVESDVGWLLDLHNLYANALNFGFDPYAVLARMPLDRVIQIHLAGGETLDGLYLDTHGRLTPPEVWRMLEYVAPRCAVRGVNFEMDSQFPAFEVLLEELAHARTILNRHGVARATL